LAVGQTDAAVDARWERRWGWGGVAFVALVLAWAIVIIASSRPGADASAEDIRSFFGPGGDSGWLFLSTALLGLAGLVFLPFLGSLRAILRRAEGGTGRLSAVVFGAGIVFAALNFVKNSIDLGVVMAVEWQDLEVDPAAWQLLDALFTGLLMHEGVALGVLVGATSVIALRTGVFPRWLAWSGVVVAILSVLSVLLFGLPLVLDLLWVLALSGLILRGVGQGVEARV
jgi:NAD(P)-dependent dehydrogenase (short-subunit alcohol dehydrogenase family)